MGLSLKKYLFFCLISLAFIEKADAQLCPPNLDLEQGDFTNWICQTGSLDNGGNITWNPGTTPVPGRHDIVSPPGGTDLYGGFPQICPNGSTFSVKLGNTNSPPGRQASQISYTYTIPATATNFSMLIWYAIVLQDPGGGSHSSVQRPRFKARIFDVLTNAPVPCIDFDFISSANLPGFRPSSINPNVVYKDWTPISIDLSGLAGRTISLEFTTLDCTLGGHFSYAYVDVSSNCNGAITGNFICPGTNSITLNAPFGFQSYRWFDDVTCTNVIGTNQTLTLSPPPAVGAIYPVEITPFPTFGCLDTLYAIVDVGVNPPPGAGPDRVICKGTQIQIGGPPLPAHQYAWTSPGPISNPNISNPFAGPVGAPTEYYLTTTDLVTGCSSQDTTVVSLTVTDTLVTVAGNYSTCISDPRTTLSVNNTSAPVQWFEQTGGPIPGATGISYTPTVSGVYWAELTQGGCTDSTGLHTVAIHPLPIPAFTPSSDTGCVTNNSFRFTNNSTAPDNSALSYLWRYNDGVIDVNTDAIRSYRRVGTYDIKLIATTAFGCKDSTAPFVYHVLPNGIPDFTWDSICTGRPMVFTNRSNENGSAQAWYSWNFNNGDPLSTLKDPLPVVYNTNPGKLDVTLKMATLGCENDTQTVVRTVQVNRQAPGVTYRTVTVPEGSTKWLSVRDTIAPVYSWRPAVQLSAYDKRFTEFTAVDDVKYLIDLTDIHTCVTTDTMQLLVLKKPGFYLPTAFTPNGDGLNDLVRPYLIRMKSLKSFSIFNRTGQLLFYTQTYGDGWDGKYQGADQGNGVYVWLLEFYDNNNRLVTEKGTITLIR